MPNSNTIHSLEEALRIFWLESSQNAAPNVSEQELKLILSAEHTFEMNAEKKAKLINRLFDTVKSPSLGTLISESIELKSIHVKELALETNIPLKTVKELIKDSIFPNNIPILLMVGLFRRLKISLKSAESAILKTYEIVMKRQVIDYGNSPAVATFRRDQNLRTRSFVKKAGRSDGKELYENREAVLKYISQLKVLMPDADA